MWRLVVAIGFAACTGTPGAQNHVDASHDGAGSDAAHDADPDGSACSNGRVVYLNYGPQTLTFGASDATLNRAAWLGVASGSSPAFACGNTTDAETVTDAVRAALSSFPITVVTTRPAAGPYVMIVFGGVAADYGVPFLYGANTQDCGDLVKSDVGWISDQVPTVQKAADYAIGAIGYGLGLTATNDPNDCMCSWGNACAQGAGPCTLSTSITAQLDCAGETNPQNEVAGFHKAFCE